MDDIVNILSGSYKTVTFRPGDRFYWSPETREVFYDRSVQQPQGLWSLLHETGHALLEHKSYQADYELIRLEVDAWEKAKALASDLAVTIDEDHVQDCIDTYRDWLYARSICPRCGNKSLQQANLAQYQCFNCHETWKVTPSRFCRTYRSTKHAQKANFVFRLADES
ncbi:hypothetical protein KDA23_03360 [Candidatus Saccharibacteria bacterium]|nr:hypothetical protein [Candidatus Saccharibacteria bacterium]